MAIDENLCRYEVHDGVALVTLNRPERNNGMTGALELAFFARLAQEPDGMPLAALYIAPIG